MAVHNVSARNWPLENRLPLVATWGADGRDLLLDLSALPRFGLRGPGAIAWLTACDCPVPESLDHVIETDGMTIARLGAEEFVILADPVAGSSRLTQLRRKWRDAPGPKGFDAYREESWCWLNLSGPGVSEALPLLTAIDSRTHAFGPGTVMQTRAMHMDAVLIRNERGGQPGLDMLFDIASSEYAADFIADVLPGFEMSRLAG
ncbi:hypothetical protein Q0601_05930 [Paracoccus onubensis]|uniref:hypothetical protein n=1 Tax=Paracoccus onubensis TaxID=1675788 RepID=UPI002730D5AF|nr:hypothetical protein [Paracoccus onubensis]MDP0926700.1 hypothetical protein [Paracoccus onubensis]